jgi:hypothetical protein
VSEPYLLFVSAQVWGLASRVSMLISGRENRAEAWVSEFAWVTSPLQGEGRMRVGSGLIDVLEDEPLTFILSPLARGEATGDGYD